MDWAATNRAYLEAGLQRLRLLLQRRVLWLRRLWKHDPLEGYQGLVISEVRANGMLAGWDREAEVRFNQEDPTAAALSRSLAELEAELEQEREALWKADTPPGLEVLARIFGLSHFERDVLLLCLAPELDPTFEHLYAYAQDDGTRKYATPHLAMTLFGWEAPEPYGVVPSALALHFSPEAPLRRSCLVVLDPVGASGLAQTDRPLRLDDRVADYLLGLNRADSRLAHLLRPVPSPLPGAEHGDLVELLLSSLASRVGDRPWPVINLIGPPSSGRRATAAALAERSGLGLCQLEAGRLPGEGLAREEMLRILEREASLLRVAFYLDATELDRGDRAAVVAFTELAERLAACLVLASREAWRLERDTLAVRVPKPTAGTQRLLWRQALDATAEHLDGAIETIVQQFDFGPAGILRSATAARNLAQLRSQTPGTVPSGEDLWQACREEAGWQLDELAQRLVPCHAWDDIVLPEDVFRQLREIAAQVANRARVYEAWGFGAKLARGRGISALFSGPSGTGKTMAAEILAHDLALDLYRIDLSGVVSKYIGETEKNLRRVFDVAEQSGAILFFDEADALFGKRSEVKDSHDRYANIEVNYLLQRMEDYRGLAILATNMKSHLDPAFLRRLRFVVEFPFPDADLRWRIWEKAFPPQAPSEGLDYGWLARLEIPGGNIKNIAVNAAFLAADAGVPIRMEQVVLAARREYAKIEKLVTQSEFGCHYAGARR